MGIFYGRFFLTPKASCPLQAGEKMHAASGVILEAEAKDLLTSDILLLKNTIAE